MKSSSQNETQRAEKFRKASVAERYMRSRINLFSLMIMLVVPLLVDVGLRSIEVYIDTYIAVYYQSTAVTALQWILYYTILLLATAYQCAGFGILGYSVMRYGVKKSLCPILLSITATTISTVSGIVEVIYLAGTAAVKSNIEYLATYWILNYLLAIFTNLCVIFLCAMLRIAFIRGTTRRVNRMQVDITEETPEQKHHNVLRRLFLWMTGLLFIFKFVPTVSNTFVEIMEVGGPGDIWDWITLLQPYAELLLLTALGYFVMLWIGSIMTRQNAEQAARAESLIHHI